MILGNSELILTASLGMTSIVSSPLSQILILCATPSTRPCPSSSIRRFKPDWLKTHPWMHYSQISDGVYCCACVIFLSDWWSKSWSWSHFGIGLRPQIGQQSMQEWVPRSALAVMKEFLSRYKSPSQSGS